jgi:hypothetical protein
VATRGWVATLYQLYDSIVWLPWQVAASSKERDGAVVELRLLLATTPRMSPKGVGRGAVWGWPSPALGGTALRLPHDLGQHLPDDLVLGNDADEFLPLIDHGQGVCIDPVHLDQRLLVR